MCFLPKGITSAPGNPFTTFLISIVMIKTHLQINKEWNTLSTKSSVPNGRINGDVILLRAMNK